MDASISAADLRKSLLGSTPPLVIDVRRNERFLEATDLIRGAPRRDPARIADWSRTLPRAASVVVYCVHGHEVSQNAAKALAGVVRGADTGRLDLAAQAPGLLAISQGLSRIYENDLEMLEHGMVMYDALYAWCRSQP